MHLFKSEQGKKEVLELYDQKLQELQINHQTCTLETSQGDTHVIITGNPENPPLLLIHGANGCAPIALEVYPNLSKAFRVYSVDVPGEPNKSAENLPKKKDLSYGHWVQDVMKQLDLKEVTLLGFSLGGFAVWKSLLVDESRVKSACLVAPMGIVNGNPLKGLFKVYLPMKRFMKTGKRKHLDRVIQALFSEPDDFAYRFLAKVLMNFHLDFSPLPTIKKKEAAQITTPLTLIGAEQDLMFPGKKLLKRAERIFPSLQKSVLLPEAKHVQSKKDNEWIEGVISQ